MALLEPGQLDTLEPGREESFCVPLAPCVARLSTTQAKEGVGFPEPTSVVTDEGGVNLELQGGRPTAVIGIYFIIRHL